MVDSIFLYHIALESNSLHLCCCMVMQFWYWCWPNTTHTSSSVMSDIPVGDTEEERSVSLQEESSSENNKDEGASSSTSKDSDEEPYEDYTDLAIMKNNEPLTLDNLPKIGGQPALAYKEVMMPAKLYTSTDNIEKFVESQLVDDWNVTSKWHVYLESTSVADITKVTLRKSVQSQVLSVNSCWLSLATVNQIFSEYDKQKKKTNDPLIDKDRVFLHLLVGPEEFGVASIAEMASYLRESRCYHECIRLIQKFCGQDVDIPLLETYINPRPNKRFCDIIIFISHFFGRADRVLEREQVQTLWDTLVFVGDFVNALVDQSRITRAKMKTEKSTKSAKAGEGSMGAHEREIEEESGKGSFDRTKGNDDVHVPEDVSTKKKKRKGAENKTPVAKKKGKPESIGEDQIQQMAKDKKMTHSAVSVVSRQCILVSHHIVLKPY